MRPLPSVTVRKSALAKGFVEGRETDHERYYFQLDGRKTSWLVSVSHGASELRLDEIRNNARALKIHASDLFKILSCEHDAAKTLELFRSVFPVAPAEPVPSDEADKLKRELGQLEEAMKVAASEEEALQLLARWTAISAELSALE